MADVNLWSKTAADNDDADAAINWLEGQAPSTVNNSGRAMMAGIANWRDDIGGALTTTGSLNAYLLTTNSDLGALADGVMLSFVANHANTGASTLNVDGLGAKAIRKRGDEALVAGDLLSSGHYTVQYDASANSAAGAWLLLGTPSAASLLTDIKSVDGAGSGLDADLLDGQEGSYYLNRDNHTGTTPTAGIADGAVTTAKVGDDQITNPKLANMAAGRVKARGTGSTGDPEDIAVGSSLTLDTTSLRVNEGATGAALRAAADAATAKTALSLVKADVGLGNVDNTSDANKPISTATQTALNAKAPLASPALTGTPTAPTAAAGTNSTQIATTEYVDTAVGGASVTITAGSGITVTDGDTVSINTNNVGGIGAYGLMQNVSGGSIVSAATVSGSGLRWAVGTSSSWASLAIAPSGTWRNVAGGTVSNNLFGLFMRTA